MPLSIFGFRALWSPWFLLIIIVGMALYLLLTTKMRHRFQDTHPVTKKQLILFHDRNDFTLRCQRFTCRLTWSYLIFNSHGTNGGSIAYGCSINHDGDSKLDVEKGF